MKLQWLLLILALACCKSANEPINGNSVIADSTFSIVPEDGQSFLLVYNSGNPDQQALLETYVAVFNSVGDAVRFEDPVKRAGFWRYQSGTYFFAPVRGDDGLVVYLGDQFIRKDLNARAKDTFQLRHINEGEEEIVIRAGDPARMIERFNTGERLELEEMFLLHDRL